MTVNSPRSPHPALPLEQWPPTDRAAWDAALRRPDFLDEGGKAATWRAASQRSAHGAYARFLGWLVAQGLDLASKEPVARITPERMRAYISFLQGGRAPLTIASYLGVLCMALLALFPEHDWRWVQALQTRMKRRAMPTRRKRERRVPAAQLAQLGLDLMQQAGDGLDQGADAGAERRRVAAARDYRDGLLIALLAFRPLRVKNLLGIEIGLHLRRSGHVINANLIRDCVATTFANHDPNHIRYVTCLAMPASEQPSEATWPPTADSRWIGITTRFPQYGRAPDSCRIQQATDASSGPRPRGRARAQSNAASDLGGGVGGGRGARSAVG
ncbi:MAG TPA: hypothetical protein VHY34_03365 [Caulobacteraceae bacterium]|nr:hypothetical protein [Caulobacteraceae bacterium]